jgi:Oxidoreductase family, NAD-binding Rossmann fold
VARSFLSWLVVVLAMSFLTSAAVADEPPKTLKAGIIGLDTSHVVAFTKLLNDPKAKGDLEGVRVVAAFPGGSQDIPASRDRLVGFTKQLKEQYDVEIVDSIDELLKKVDVVLLESVDGRPHWEQVQPVFKAKKPVFIDKPVAGSLADVLRIYDLAKETGCPVFSSSSLRFAPEIGKLKDNSKLGAVIGCATHGPCEIEEHHPDLFWYGVHGVENLFAVMGTGCESVSRVKTKETDMVTGTWKYGRVGTFRGLRGGKKDYGMVVYGSESIETTKVSADYAPLVAEICKFFKTGKPPVSAEETIELFAFMQAADESARQNGAAVTIDSVLKNARAGSAKEKK